jgi:hypothetical protein
LTTAAEELSTDPIALRAELAALNKELAVVQGETPLMQPCVTSQTIAEVISGWTGIPVGKMLADEINTVISLRDKLEKRVVGQTQALEAISRRIPEPPEPGLNRAAPARGRLSACWVRSGGWKKTVNSFDAGRHANNKWRQSESSSTNSDNVWNTQRVPNTVSDR